MKLLNRAKKCGYKVLVVTLDTWALSWRPWDLDNAYVCSRAALLPHRAYNGVPRFRSLLA